MAALLTDTLTVQLRERAAQLEAAFVAPVEEQRHTHEWSGFTCSVPAYARTRAQVSKRRLICTACARKLTDDLIFEFVSTTGKRSVYCAREDCAAL